MNERIVQLLKLCLKHKVEGDYAQYSQIVGNLLSALTILTEESYFETVQRILLDINLGLIKTEEELHNAFELKEKRIYTPLIILNEPIKVLIKGRRTKLHKLAAPQSLEVGLLTYLKLVQIDDVWGLTSVCIGTKIKGLTVLSKNDLLRVLKIAQEVPSIQYIKIDEDLYNEAIAELNS